MAADFHSRQTVVIKTHTSLSAVHSFGRFTERLEHADLVNAAPRPSNWSAARLRNQPEREAISAANTGPNGKQSITGNSQLINQIRFCENDS